MEINWVAQLMLPLLLKLFVQKRWGKKRVEGRIDVWKQERLL
jgi:hypothetical protein